MTPGVGVRQLRPADIRLRYGKRGSRFNCYLTNDSFLVNKSHSVIPTVHDESGERDFVVDVISGADSHVIERDGQRKQQRPRIVPIIFGFDYLKAQWCDKLAEIDLKTFSDVCLVTEIGLANITKHVRS